MGNRDPAESAPFLYLKGFFLMPLEGRQLSYRWALALGYHVGFRKGALTKFVALMCAESARYVWAWNQNSPTSIDRGLMQINSKAHPTMSRELMYAPIPNALYAYVLSKSGTDWSPWVAFKTGAHRKFLPVVLMVKAVGLWRLKIKEVPNKLRTERFGGAPGP